MEEEDEKEMVRIFVGGLGESVNADELRRMFELSGGAVESLDFVRSKNRSFAYVDFSPSSEKSLSKLFAKYNGCVWKGGKLKLEKAKEHYLKRLEREWAEDSAENDSANALQITEDSSEKISQNLLPPEKSDIRIFFPRLRKVKALPFNGAGKHKYSFQRFDASLPPKYFCDCEEHSGPIEEEKRANRVEAVSGGVNQEELDIMKKVMNTLFQNQTVDSVDEHNNDEDDDDDLVINFASKGNNEVTLLERKQAHRISENQLKRGTHEQGSKRVFSERSVGEPRNKKKKPLSDEHNGRGDESSKLAVEVKRVEPESSRRQPNNAQVSWSQKASWKKLVGDNNKGNNTFTMASTEEVEPILDCPMNSERDIVTLSEEDDLISDSSNVIESDSKNENMVKIGDFEGTVMETEVSVEAQPDEQIVVSSQPKRGALWMQKSSWTQLVGEIGSFSLSQPSTGTTSAQQTLEKPEDSDVLISGNNETNVSQKEEGVSGIALKDDGQAILGNDESLKSSFDGEITQIAPVRVEVSETCTFMRSAASLKEWAKTKAALSGSVKKKK